MLVEPSQLIKKVDFSFDFHVISPQNPHFLLVSSIKSPNFVDAHRRSCVRSRRDTRTVSRAFGPERAPSKAKIFQFLRRFIVPKISELACPQANPPPAQLVVAKAVSGVVIRNFGVRSFCLSSRLSPKELWIRGLLLVWVQISWIRGRPCSQ